MAERYASLSLEDLVVKETLGTGSFGRVRLVQHKDGRHFALKMLKKTEIIYLKQVCGLSLGASFFPAPHLVSVPRIGSPSINALPVG